ncbi:hypothetical protein M8PIadj_0236 [Bifidobacterium animalis]|nr:hypothetical protein M8PIadj_0236 [Bifidobacterium animalis]
MTVPSREPNCEWRNSAISECGQLGRPSHQSKKRHTKADSCTREMRFVQIAE